ncbi:MAG: 2-C-methyl-D-erythritol 4-phosphate cytidylyltransferase [Omnitrophica WOR_2 bacterium RIFCSPHIGHO2_02_FULL_45_21]|nr:MAG: 2-C-methyl-D-erythritol 4-phosphate cytidylyltransferase [Omnitrophica WOR_2 bacterium RIFCSPHIGHO2_02_FULL_45_21]
MNVEAIVPAAGLGLRLKAALPNRQAGIPKPLVKIADKPILIYTLCVLSRIKSIKRIILAVNKEYLDNFREVLKRFPLKKRIDLVLGGASRRESVENCLKTIDSAANIILVHDAVRPFVSKDLIDRLLKEARVSPAVISGVPVKATIKSVKVSKCQGVKEGCMVEKTLNRDNLWEIQTPQVFRRELLLEAYEKYRNPAVTDDASLVEKLGVKVKVVRGSYFNIKITTPEDLVFAKTIVKSFPLRKRS